jgi:L-arabinonolactonase
MAEVRVLTDVITRSGESPVWDADEERLYWVDNAEGHIFRSTPDGREMSVWRFPRLVTSIGLCADGRVIVTSGRRLFHFDLETGETDELFRSDAQTVTPFNDGKVDRQGRFVTGTVDGSLFDPNAAESAGQLEPAGRLHRLDTDLTVTPMADGIGITNGPCFSRDGSILYCNDSWARRVYAYAYDPATGEASNRRVLAQFEDDATPDGATVDEDDCLWIANFHGGEVRRYTPDGTLDRRVRVPVDSPTSVMFGGPGLDILFVTSQGDAHVPGDAAPPKPSPLAGRVFAVHGIGVRGVPERRFGA